MRMPGSLRWLILAAVVLGLVIVPFVLFGKGLEDWAQQLIESAKARPVLVALLLCMLLAVDIVIPVPSSLVSTTCGLLLGFAAGTFVSFAGMSIGSIAGYWLGRYGGRPLAARLVGRQELDRLERLNRRVGDYVIAVCRPLPVLAEASVIFAGLSLMPARRFALLCALSNLGISAVYAGVGAFAAHINSFLVAFAFSILIPAAAMGIARIFRAKPE